MSCQTCSDQARPGIVEELLEDGMALVRLGAEPEEVCLDLVSAAPGDTVLVHAGIALRRMD